MSLPPQPESAREAARARKTVARARFIASLLEEEEEDAGADRRYPQEHWRVVGGLHGGRAARVDRIDPRRDVLGLGANPAEPHPQEEDEPLLGAELEAQRRREVVLGDALEEDLRPAVAREPARVAGEEVAAFEMERGRDAPFEGNHRHAPAQSEAQVVPVEAAFEAQKAPGPEHRGQPRADRSAGVDQQSDAVAAIQRVPPAGIGLGLEARKRSAFLAVAPTGSTRTAVRVRIEAGWAGGDCAG